MNIERKTFKFASATALAVLAGFCGDTQALAQSIILDNTGNGNNGYDQITYNSGYGTSFAQSFTTGNNSYTLNSISPLFEYNGSGNAFQLSLYSDNSGVVGSQIAMLSGPGNPQAGTQAYSPTTTLSLQPATTYWVVASTAQSGSPNDFISLTTDTSFTTSDGWSVGNSSMLNYGQSSWTTPDDSNLMQFSIGATITPVPEPSTLALTAAGCVAGAVIFRRRRTDRD